ncbi:MAG: peptidyl-prolyl cis-trans isomerase, partial [Candidatus Eiseniibacteriota bacterium]
VLDSALRATHARFAARGDTLRDLERLGTLTRDSTVAHLAPVFDTTLTRRLADAWAAIPKPSSDSSLMSQLRTLGTMPAVAAGDLNRVLAYSSDGDIRVHELLDSWRGLSPTQRPRVSTPAQIQDLACNALFERLLRRDARARDLAHRPDIVAAVASKREYIAVSHLVEREVYSTLNADSLTLLRYYRAHAGEFDLPLRVRILRLDLPDRAAASRMAIELRDPAQADSLIARGRRRHVEYVSEIARESDSLRFDRALAAAPGSVLGPDSTRDGWTVLRVLEVVAPHSRTFAEARPLVEHQWYGDEGERRMVALIDRLRRQTTIRTNPAALTRLLREGVPSSAPVASH